MKNKQALIRIGEQYKFKCRDCLKNLDRKGDLCCSCLLLSKEKAKETQKAELRALTLMMKKERPELLKNIRQQAREMAITKVSEEYGIKLK